jgi:DNA-3-methyladenine glycosylase
VRAVGRAKIVPQSFFARGTVEVAPDLLGKYLVRVRKGERMVVRIVEVEAYRGSDDPASHAFRGPTPRNAPMFGEPGHAYVYFTYGNHYMLNVTTQKTGTPGAVLIRGVQPIEGVDVMRRLRPNVPDSELTNGPGKLTKALGVDKSLNGSDMTRRGALFVLDRARTGFEIWRSTRVGIGKAGLNRLWRFYIKGNPYVSKHKPIRELKFC